MIYAILNWTFDLFYLIGTILAIWPLLTTNCHKAKNINTVGWLAERDAKEVIPQIKWSWTGIVLLALSVVSKLFFIYISSTNELSDVSLIVIILIIVGCIIGFTTIIRIMLINRYWRQID